MVAALMKVVFDWVDRDKKLETFATGLGVGQRVGWGEDVGLPAVAVLPRIGEIVALDPIKAQKGAFYLDRVVDVRHFWMASGEQEVHIMLQRP